jgi:hypothetical protein
MCVLLLAGVLHRAQEDRDRSESARAESGWLAELPGSAVKNSAPAVSCGIIEESLSYASKLLTPLQPLAVLLQLPLACPSRRWLILCLMCQTLSTGREQQWQQHWRRLLKEMGVVPLLLLLRMGPWEVMPRRNRPLLLPSSP